VGAAAHRPGTVRRWPHEPPAVSADLILRLESISGVFGVVPVR
jgi:hypothetical protein